MKNHSYDILDYKASAFRKERRSRKQARTFGALKRESRRSARRAGKIASDEE